MTPFMSINEDVAKVIRHSQNISQAEVDAMMDSWYAAKQKIIDAWGGNLIMTAPEEITFHLSTEEKRNRINEFADVVSTNYQNEHLAGFIDWARTSEIFNNKLERDYHLGDTAKISAGTKFIKAFKYFETNEKALRELQDRCSAIIQEDKITGTLTFSVHPLDFLSASENNHHWRSCHALDGEYRAGNLSYLMDSSTIICYLTSGDEQVKLPHFPEDVLWNSKKWRMWLYLDDNWRAMFAGRQYPFFSPSALDFVQHYFLHSIGQFPSRWSSWYNDYIESIPRGEKNYTESLYDRYVALRHKLYAMRDLVSDCERPLHFNDLTQSSFYVPYYCWTYSGNSYHFSIGAKIPCTCCNGARHITRSNSLVCNTCELTFGTETSEDIRYCAHCESREFFDDMTYVEGLDDWICEDCAELYTKNCECCGEVWFRTDLTFDRERDLWLCIRCNRPPRSNYTWLDEDVSF